MRTFLALIILILPFQAWAEETSYFDMQIPVMDGAENIKHERNETFFTVSVEYDLKVKDIDEVYDFYDAFFKENGWSKKGKPLPEKPKKAKWLGSPFYIDEQGKANYTSGATWQKENLPVTAVARLNITNYEHDYFFAHISIVTKPNLYPSHLYRIVKSRELNLNPKEIFLLINTIGIRAFDFKTMNFPDISNEMAKIPIVNRYRYALKQDKCDYAEFGAQFVNKTKPIDGRFIDPTIGDSKKLAEKMKEYQATGEDDPLEEWRAIQEKRIEWEKNKYKGCEQEK